MKKLLLTLGDSLTNIGNQTNGWARMLDAQMCNYSVKNYGLNGFTSSDYVKHLPNIVPPDVLRRSNDILLWLGTNDVLQINEKPISNSQFGYNIQSIVEYLRYLNPLLNFTIMSIPINTYTINEWIPYEKSIIYEFNKILKFFADKNGFQYIDVNENTNPYKLESTDFVDGIHFNDTGNKKIYLNVLKRYEEFVC